MGVKKRFRKVTEGEVRKSRAKNLPLPTRNPKLNVGNRGQRLTKLVTEQTRKRD